MTVAELLRRLAALPPDMEVCNAFLDDEEPRVFPLIDDMIGVQDTEVGRVFVLTHGVGSLAVVSD